MATGVISQPNFSGAAAPNGIQLRLVIDPVSAGTIRIRLRANPDPGNIWGYWNLLGAGTGGARYSITINGASYASNAVWTYDWRSSPTPSKRQTIYTLFDQTLSFTQADVFISASASGGSTNLGSASPSGYASTAYVAPTPAPSWNTTSLDTFGRVGSSFSTSVSANNTSSYSLASGSLPGGLNLSSGGTISGTMTTGASQIFSFRINANGPGGTVTSNTFYITRFQALPTWADNTLNTTNLRVGTSYADSVTANNATSYGVTGLPANGISFSDASSSGIVSGTPTSTSTTSFTIFAYNADGNSISAGFTFIPKAPLPVWIDQTLATTTIKVGQTYSDGVSASSAASYAIVGEGLPPGITLNTVSGAITGTPTTVGGYDFAVTATNSSSESITSSTLTIVVEPAGSGKVWNGSTWVLSPFKVWNGSTWVEAQAKVWNGASWADPSA